MGMAEKEKLWKPRFQTTKPGRLGTGIFWDAHLVDVPFCDDASASKWFQPCRFPSADPGALEVRSGAASKRSGPWLGIASLKIIFLHIFTVQYSKDIGGLTLKPKWGCVCPFFWASKT